MHFSIDGRTIPVLSRQSANVENSFAPQPYTNTTNLSDRSDRQMGYQANSCDSVENKTSPTSYSDVAKKLVMSSIKTNDGDNLDKHNADDNDTMTKHEESSIETDSSTNNEEKDSNSSIGDMKDMCKEKHNLNKSEHDDDDETQLRTSKDESFVNDSNEQMSSGTALIAFPYMQVRFCYY